MLTEYRVHVYGAGASTSSTDFLISESELAVPPTVGGQNVDVRRGTTESRPWQLNVIDASDFLSAKLSDAAGKMLLIGRLARCQARQDGGSWVTLATGRITNISLGADVATYSITVQDERWSERGTKVWTRCGRDDNWPTTGAQQKAGTMLIPPGVDGQYGPFSHPKGFLGTSGRIYRTSGDLALVVPEVPIIDGNWTANEFAVGSRTTQFMVDDLKGNAEFGSTSTDGNFETVRCKINGTDREVHAISFGPAPVVTASALDYMSRELQIDMLNHWTVGGGWPFIWVVMSTASSGDVVSSAFLHAPAHEPTDHVPLLIGGENGIHPFTLTRKLYDEAGVRYSTAAFDLLEDDPDILPMRHRITQPESLAGFLNRAIYGPTGVVPFVNANGEIAPKKLWRELGVTPASYYQFTSTNATDPHPEWHQIGRDRVTRLNFNYLSESQPVTAEGVKEASADVLNVEDRTYTLNSTRSTSTIDVYEVDIDFSGYHGRRPFTAFVSTNFDAYTVDFVRAAGPLAEEIFGRFDGGPMRGTIQGLSTSESVEPGDFVRITIPTFPSPETQSRGATVVAQILSRVDTPAGPDFEWMHAGTDDQPLSPPTISLAKSTADQYNTVVLTVSNLSTLAGATWRVRTAVGSTQPAANSHDWKTSTRGTSTGDYSLYGYPSGSKVWGQGMQWAANRAPSSWASPVSSTLSQLTQPSSVSVDRSSGGMARVNIGLGSTDRQLEVLHAVSTSTTSTLGLDATLGAGTTEYWLSGITKGSTNQVGVRHKDSFGGRSDITRTEFTASTSNPTAPGIARIAVLRGGACTGWSTSTSTGAGASAPSSPAAVTVIGFSNE